MLDYPAPRYPKLKRPNSVDELMPRARHLVNQPPSSDIMNPVCSKPSYGIEAGDKILFVVLSEYDQMVIEAMYRAMKEKGASVDLLVLDSTPVVSPEELAVHEAIALDKDEGDYNYYYTMICNLLRTSTARAMIELEKYSMVIAGQAGAPPDVPVPWYRFRYTGLEDFASAQIDFPLDVQKLIDDKLYAQIMSCKVLKLTDPEGTDVQWTNYSDGRVYNPGHMYARPSYIGHGFGGKDDCSGVVAGTLNHMGAFPHCKAYIEGGQVVRVEGGGKYGEVWRQKLEKYKDVRLPAFPIGTRTATSLTNGEVEKYQISDPGLFWWWEAAIGTTPGVFRLPKEGRFECYANFLHDRKRAGYIHNGFGPLARGARELIEVGLPWTHLHIHTIFANLEGKTDDEKTIKIIDKGHLTALDDEEVRLLASKYGDPDELLNEVWVPAIPGINTPGDYMKDYAQDPISWIKREAVEHPLWIE